MFVGAHFWFAPKGAAFTSPGAGNIAQEGTWPDEDEPNWDNWYLGIVEGFDLDPKYGPTEQILRPSPGAVQAIDEIVPFAIPEVSITLSQVPALAWQLALNLENIWATPSDSFTPNGGGGPGVRGILKSQKYDHENNLVLDYWSWAFMKLKGALKGAPKTMTKPEFVSTLLYSSNNAGSDV
jgi:hypothetical protein